MELGDSSYAKGFSAGSDARLRGEPDQDGGPKYGSYEAGYQDGWSHVDRFYGVDVKGKWAWRRPPVILQESDDDDTV